MNPDFGLTDAPVIPDSATVSAARKLREERRRQQEGPDFVPLDPSDERTSSSDRYGNESRLVREDDEIGEEDVPGLDDGLGAAKVAFGGRPTDEQRRKQLQTLSSSVDIASDESDDEEFRRWEANRIRVGGMVSLPSTLPHDERIQFATSLANAIKANQHRKPHLCTCFVRVCCSSRLNVFVF